MSFGSIQDQVPLENLSALVDGEVDEPGDACSRWHGDPRVRSAWHAYHLIGDVLRSEDLATDPARDAAFLQRLSRRLAQEPVVFVPGGAGKSATSASTAPRPSSATRRSRWPWRSASAVAAGFVAVAGVYALMEPARQSPTREPALASAPPSAAVRREAPLFASIETPAAPPAGTPDVSTGKLMRDARLDAYLAAHEQFAGSTALGMPSVFLRSATVSAPGR